MFLLNFLPDAVIGADVNRQTFLRSGEQTTNDASFSTPNILSADNYELFTLRSYLNGTLALYQGYNLDVPFAAHDYGTPQDVQYFGIR